LSDIHFCATFAADDEAERKKQVHPAAPTVLLPGDHGPSSPQQSKASSSILKLYRPAAASSIAKKKAKQVFRSSTRPVPRMIVTAGSQINSSNSTSLAQQQLRTRHLQASSTSAVTVPPVPMLQLLEQVNQQQQQQQHAQQQQQQQRNQQREQQVRRALQERLRHVMHSQAAAAPPADAATSNSSLNRSLSLTSDNSATHSAAPAVQVQPRSPATTASTAEALKVLLLRAQQQQQQPSQQQQQQQLVQLLWQLLPQQQQQEPSHAPTAQAHSPLPLQASAKQDLPRCAMIAKRLLEQVNMFTQH
jgi:hypothetical protein